MAAGRPAEAIIYWFVTLCHEVAHNLVSDHSSAHSFYTESLVTQYFTPIARVIAARSAEMAGARGEDMGAPPPSYSR